MNEQDVVSFFTGKGYEPHQAAGIAGNLMQESTLNPTAKNPKSGAFGFAQWLGPRKKAFMDFAMKAKKDITDPLAQLEFIDLELNTTERKAKDRLLTSRDATEAAVNFSNHYERAGANEKKNATRASYANKILGAFIPSAQAGETMDKPLSFEEWVAAGKPKAPSATSTTSEIPTRKTSEPKPLSFEEWVAAGKPKAPATLGEKIVGSPVGRFVLGAAEYPLGVGRFVENVATEAGVPGLGGIGRFKDKMDAMKARGKAAPTELSSYDPLGIVARAGKEILYKGGESVGLDPRSWDIAGGMGSTVAAGGVLNKLAPAKTFLGNVAQSTAVGGGLGLVNPNAANLSENIANAGTGAAFGLATPIAITGGAKTLGWLRDLPYRKAANLLQNVVGADKNAVIAAGRAAAPELTGAQAAADIHNAQLQALGQVAKDRNTASFFSKKAELATADAQSVLNTFAGGATQAEANLTRKAAKQALNAKTTPMREAAMASAPYVDTSTIISNIDAKLADPAIATSKVNRRVLSAVKKEIENWTKKNTTLIDVEALYGVRKNAINEEIQRQISKLDPKASAQYSAKLLAEINPLIDDAIVKAGGTEWPSYMSAHASGLKDIERQEMASVLSELYRNKSYDRFQKIVNGGDTKAVRDIFGSGNVDINAAMGDAMLPFKKIADDLTRTGVMFERAKAGSTKLAEELRTSMGRTLLPNPLNPKIAIVNKVLELTEPKINKAAFDALEKGMRSGKTMADMLDGLPSAHRGQIEKALTDPKVLRQLTQLSTRNALAPDQQNQNALAQ